MHLGHTIRSLTPQMAPFVFGTRYNILLLPLAFTHRTVLDRFDMCVIDLDQTATMLRQALNFTAHIAYKVMNYSAMLLYN